MVYVFEDSSLEITPLKGKTQKMAMKAGDVVWMDSGHHEAANRGKSDMHALIVEFKGSTKKLGK
jgi:hypothetical protein